MPWQTKAEYRAGKDVPCVRNALPVANEGGTKRILRPLLPETGQRVEKVCCCRRNIKKDAGEHALLLFQSLPYTRRPGEGRGGVGLRERVRRTRSHGEGGPYAAGKPSLSGKKATPETARPYATSRGTAKTRRKGGAPLPRTTTARPRVGGRAQPALPTVALPVMGVRGRLSPPKSSCIPRLFHGVRGSARLPFLPSSLPAFPACAFIRSRLRFRRRPRGLPRRGG